MAGLLPAMHRAPRLNDDRDIPLLYQRRHRDADIINISATRACDLAHGTTGWASLDGQWPLHDGDDMQRPMAETIRDDGASADVATLTQPGTRTNRRQMLAFRRSTPHAIPGSSGDAASILATRHIAGAGRHGGRRDDLSARLIIIARRHRYHAPTAAMAVGDGLTSADAFRRSGPEASHRQCQRCI